MASSSTSPLPQAAAIPISIPRAQPAWDEFVRSLNSWRPQPLLWTNITLANGWTGTAQYQVGPNGRLYCRGQITPGTLTDGTVLATLPYPAAQLTQTLALVVASPNSVVRLDVNTAGQILIYGAGAGTLKVSLDQLAWATI